MDVCGGDMEDCFLGEVMNELKIGRNWQASRGKLFPRGGSISEGQVPASHPKHAEGLWARLS